MNLGHARPSLPGDQLSKVLKCNTLTPKIKVGKELKFYHKINHCKEGSSENVPYKNKSICVPQLLSKLRENFMVKRTK